MYVQLTDRAIVFAGACVGVGPRPLRPSSAGGFRDRGSVVLQEGRLTEAE